MKKQTAVEWLVDQIKEYDFSPRENTYLIEIPSWILKEKIKEAKEMEKEQIKDAYVDGRVDYRDKIIKPSETYYNETFGGEQ